MPIRTSDSPIVVPSVLTMSSVDGEDTARMIRSTQNVNQSTPIVAVSRLYRASMSIAELVLQVTSYESRSLSEAGTVFSSVMSVRSLAFDVSVARINDPLQKPVNRAACLAVLEQLGFVLKEVSWTASFAGCRLTTTQSHSRT